MTAPEFGSTPAWLTTAVKVLGLLVVLATVADIVSDGFFDHRPPLHLSVAAVVALAALAALALRRRHPVAVLVVTLVLTGVLDLLAGSSSLPGTGRVAVVIALYVVGTRAGIRGGLVASSASWVVLSVTELFDRGASDVLGDLILVVAVTGIFLFVRSYRALIDSYRDRAEQAEREQGWQTNRAVGAERVRIARELHDVVAHHVSLLVVQAGAVRESLPADHPTRPVLDSMIDGGRHAMSELRDMLDALRLDGPAGTTDQAVAALPDPAGGTGPVEAAVVDAAPRTPQPDVDQVSELIGGARAAGMDVVLSVEGPRVDLPPTVSLAAYRIVQESLTNVVKHAAASEVRVRLAYGDRSFEVEVVNTPRSIAALPRYPDATEGDLRAGHGINGMRERAAMANGDLTAGPCPEGWRVLGRFPLEVVPGGAGRIPAVGATG
jgi:signal transduction histidine kinase